MFGQFGVGNLLSVSAKLRCNLSVEKGGWANSKRGMQHFQVLTAGLEFPMAEPGETVQSLNARVAEYSSSVNAAGLSLFQNFFRVAGIIALAAVPSALAMRQPLEGDRWSEAKAG